MEPEEIEKLSDLGDATVNSKTQQNIVGFLPACPLLHYQRCILRCHK